MANDAGGEHEEGGEAREERGYYPKGEISTTYPFDSTVRTGRGSPFYGGPTRPPLSHPPSYDLISKKRRRVYRLLLLGAFLLMFFGGIAGFVADNLVPGGLSYNPALYLACALLGFLGIVFYGIPLAWKALVHRS